MSVNGKALLEKQRATAFAIYLLRALPLSETIEEALEATEVALSVRPELPAALPKQKILVEPLPLRTPLVIHHPKTGRVQGVRPKRRAPAAGFSLLMDFLGPAGAELAWRPTGTQNSQGKKGWYNEQSGETRYQEIAPGTRKPAQQQPSSPRQPAQQEPSGQRRQGQQESQGGQRAPTQQEKPKQSPMSPQQQKQFQELQQAAQKDAADPNHAVNRLKSQMAEVKFGNGPAINTIRSTQGSPLTAQDHEQVAAFHARIGGMMQALGKQDIAASNFAAAKYHRTSGAEKTRRATLFPSETQVRKLDDVQNQEMRHQSYSYIESRLNQTSDYTEENTIQGYTGSYKHRHRIGAANAEELNEALRKAMASGGQIPAHLQGPVAVLDKAIDESPDFKEPTYTYRGIHLEAGEASKLKEKLKKSLETGGLIKFGDYMSTSTDPTVASSFSLGDPGEESFTFEIKAKKGLHVGNYSEHEDEEEVLLSRNAKYRVIAHKKIKTSNSSGGSQQNITVYQLEQL